MATKKILRLLAAVFIISVCIVVSLPEFGVDISSSLNSTGGTAISLMLIIMWALFIVSAFYLAFAPHTDKDNAQQKRREWFERTCLVVFIVFLSVKFFYPKVSSLLLLFSCLAIYGFFFWRRIKQGKRQ